MSMAQLLGVWNSMPRTEAAGLATENMKNAAWSYAAMDKAVNQTSTQTTTYSGGGSIFGDLLPAVGGLVGGVIGGPAGAMLGSSLGGMAGGLAGGNNAAVLGGMGAGTAQGLGTMLETTSPWSWKRGTNSTKTKSGTGLGYRG